MRMKGSLVVLLALIVSCDDDERTPESLCQRLGRLPGGTPTEPYRELSSCVDVLNLERTLGSDHWRCVSSCLGEIEDMTSSHTCDSACALPELELDCDSVLRAEDVSSVFDEPAAAAPPTVAPSSCSQTFELGQSSVHAFAAVPETTRVLY